MVATSKQYEAHVVAPSTQAANSKQYAIDTMTREWNLKPPEWALHNLYSTFLLKRTQLSTRMCGAHFDPGIYCKKSYAVISILNTK